MTYNMTELQASETVIDLVVFANRATEMVLGNLFMIAIFIILLMVLKRHDFEETLLVSSFICFVISLLFRAAGMIHYTLIIVFMLIMAFTTLYMYVVKRKA